MRTSQFVTLAQSGIICHMPERKAAFHAGAEIVLRRLAKLLGLKRGEFDLRHNQGGDAVSGEITLHSDTLYVQMYQTCIGDRSGRGSAGVLWRRCEGRKDYTGGRNHWSKWEELKDLEALAKEMKAVSAPMFQVV